MPAVTRNARANAKKAAMTEKTVPTKPMAAKKSVSDKDRMWMKLFKTAEPNTEHESLLYMSRIAYICIAEYLLRRQLLPPSLFEKRRVAEDLQIHTFKNKHEDGSVNRWGSKLSDMMRGMTEAIMNKYVRQAVIMINEKLDEPDCATEVFTVSFVYDQKDCVRVTDQDGQTMLDLSYSGKEKFRGQVAHVLETVFNTSMRLPPLNKSRVRPRMKLTYYDERIPQDYQPFAFEASKNLYYFEAGRVPPQWEIGTVTTAYSGVAVDMQSHYIQDVEQLRDDVMERIPTQSSPSEPTLSLDGSLFRDELEVRRESPAHVPQRLSDEMFKLKASSPKLIRERDMNVERQLTSPPDTQKVAKATTKTTGKSAVPTRKQPARAAAKRGPLNGGVTKRQERLKAKEGDNGSTSSSRAPSSSISSKPSNAGSPPSSSTRLVPSSGRPVHASPIAHRDSARRALPFVPDVAISHSHHELARSSDDQCSSYGDE